MSDPLGWCLPWLGLARDALSAGKYLSVRRQVKRRREEREATENLRFGGILLAQLCPVHGWPEDRKALQPDSPRWCGCISRTVAITGVGEPVRFARQLAVRDPATGGFAVCEWPGYGPYAA